MLNVYTHKKSHRLIFILDFILKEQLGLSYEITTNAKTFRSHVGPKINYSMEKFEDNPLHVFPVLLLFQEDVTEHQIEVDEWNGVNIFYKVKKGDFPFDIFAASFFMITRYEEYLYAKKDRFGRYDPRNSIAWKNKFLYEPIVNIWINRFTEKLIKHYPELEIKEQKYEFQPTIDVDNAFAYLHKGFLRTAGGLTMNMLRYKFHNFGHRLRVLMGKEADPYDNFDKINQIHEKYNLKPYIFFLLGNYGGFDRAVSPHNSHFRKLISEYKDRAHVGIHASYASSITPKHLKEEIEALEDILEDHVLHNRFHFIKYKMPDSYERLILNDIQNDFTMGYASRPGFRAGFAGSYKYFNLKTNTATNLRIHPFQIMDATLNFYSKHTPDEAYKKAIELIDKVKAVKGKLYTVWHNESLSGISPWKGWENLYEKIIDYAVKD